METLWQDIRLGFRTLTRAPLFTIAVVLTLGLGIGANAAVFTIVNRMLLKPMPVRDPGGLYVLAVQHEGSEQPHNVSWLDYEDYPEERAIRGSRSLRRQLRRPQRRSARGTDRRQLRHEQFLLHARRAARNRPGRATGRGRCTGRRPGHRSRPLLLEEALQREPIGCGQDRRAERQAVHGRGGRPRVVSRRVCAHRVRWVSAAVDGACGCLSHDVDQAR